MSFYKLNLSFGKNIALSSFHDNRSQNLQTLMRNPVKTYLKLININSRFLK